MFEFTPIIAIPARNEEERLPALFASLAAQTWLTQQANPLRIVIVLNNCTDGSHQAVLSAVERYPALDIHLLDVTFEAHEAHVGSARKLAMDTALACAADPTRTAILTTDADSTPLPDWVSANLRHLSDGIDLVCGLIWYDNEEYEKLGIRFSKRLVLRHKYMQAIDHLTALLNPLPHDPWPRHTDQCGASLALRAEVYRVVGGLPRLPSKEDTVLVERVQEAGYRVRHPMDVVVETSARLIGRAAGGVAEFLQSCTQEVAEDRPVLVEYPKRIWQRLLKTHQTETVDDTSEYIPVEVAMPLLEAMIKKAEGQQCRRPLDLAASAHTA